MPVGKENKYIDDSFVVEEKRHRELMKKQGAMVRTMEGLKAIMERSEKIDLSGIDQVKESVDKMSKNLDKFMKLVSEDKSSRSDEGYDKLVQAIGIFTKAVGQKLDNNGQKLDALTQVVIQYNQPREMEVTVTERGYDKKIKTAKLKEIKA
jgi:hypothetical protein